MRLGRLSAAQVPRWAWKAAHYLGDLADPIGIDQYSFTPSDAYLSGFVAGLRAVWAAARSEEPHEGGAEPDAAASHRIAEGLGQLLRGHGGLTLDEVERAGQNLLHRLRDGFQHATVRDRLPAGTTMNVDWFQAPGCNYGDRPYRLINWHYHGLKIAVAMSKPEPLRAETTPIPGISRARDAEHALIVIDANRPSAQPLLLAIGDVHPDISVHAASLIDEWAEQCLTTLLTEFNRMLTGALARLGYNS